MWQLFCCRSFRGCSPLRRGAGTAVSCWGQGVRVSSGDLKVRKQLEAPTEPGGEKSPLAGLRDGSPHLVKGETPCPSMD